MARLAWWKAQVGRVIVPARPRGRFACRVGSPRWRRKPPPCAAAPSHWAGLSGEPSGRLAFRGSNRPNPPFGYTSRRLGRRSHPERPAAPCRLWMTQRLWCPYPMPPSSYDLMWSLILPSASDGGRVRSNASRRTAPTRVSNSAQGVAGATDAGLRFGHGRARGPTSRTATMGRPSVPLSCPHQAEYRWDRTGSPGRIDAGQSRYCGCCRRSATRLFGLSKAGVEGSSPFVSTGITAGQRPVRGSSRAATSPARVGQSRHTRRHLN
jgi:hypothetical protein